MKIRSNQGNKTFTIVMDNGSKYITKGVKLEVFKEMLNFSSEDWRTFLIFYPSEFNLINQ